MPYKTCVYLSIVAIKPLFNNLLIYENDHILENQNICKESYYFMDF